jgi:hypothetical protein
MGDSVSREHQAEAKATVIPFPRERIVRWPKAIIKAEIKRKLQKILALIYELLDGA